MKFIILLILTFFLLTKDNLYAQCNCIMTGETHQASPDKLYEFKNGCTAGLCSPVFKTDDKIDYSYSAILDCRNSGILSDFDNTQIDSIVFENDTLKIFTFYILLNGKGFEPESNLFKTRLIYCVGQKLSVKDIYNYEILLYSKKEIQSILESSKKMNSINSYADYYSISNKLLMCYLSGEKSVLDIFHGLKNKVKNWDNAKEYYYNECLIPQQHKFQKYIETTKK